MNTLPPLDAEREQQLTALLLAVVEGIEAGQVLDRARLLAEHPEFADELAEFLAGRDEVERLAAPLLKLKEEAGRPKEEGRQAPAVGQLGDFRLLREVGRGGMGIVYEAEQLSLNRRVALKVLSFAAALDPRQLQRFKNEAQAAALLHHTNIVPVHAVGSERGVHYYAMQFIEGQSLAALLHELRRADDPLAEPDRGPGAQGERQQEEHRPAAAESRADRGGSTVALFPGSSVSHSISTERTARRRNYFRRVADLGRKAAEALEHAHQLGVVHRDVKPANLLLDARGNLWITDFGLALLQSRDGVTTTGELVGTLRYMSPEQAATQRALVDHRTDIYSLGATLYELLTLQPIFAGSDRHQLLQQIARDEPRPPRSIDRTIPVELETIVLKALAKVPGERYATAQELADDLQRFLDDQPVRARRPTILDRAARWSRRHRPVVVSAVVLLMVATAGLLASTLLIAGAHAEAKAAYQRERQKAEEARRQQARAEASFVQARQAVDFFTGVSEEELVDRSSVLEVRRTLLEAALQYYQEFIDQHQDDPSIQQELAASREHVTQILDELAAQSDFLQLMLEVQLLTDQGVREDLRVTPAQEEKVKALSDQLTEQRRETFWTLPKLRPEEQGKLFVDMAAANEKAVAAVLSPAQVKRLHQIGLQQRGPQAFADPDVAKALHLTRDQKKRIRAIQEEVRGALHDLWQGARPPRRNHTEARETMQQVWKESCARIVALLTPKQRAGWSALTGAAFRGPVPLSLQFGFGAPFPRPH